MSPSLTRVGDVLDLNMHANGYAQFLLWFPYNWLWLWSKLTCPVLGLLHDALLTSGT